MTEGTAHARPRARIAILSHGTSEFDSRAQRIARTCAAAGDTVTIYSRFLAGLPAEEELHGYRIVRLPLSAEDARQAAEGATGSTGATSSAGTSRSTTGGASRPPTSGGKGRSWRAYARRLPTGSAIRQRFRQFPIRPRQRAPWFADQVEPHDIWHGMWAGSLPALELVRARHG